MKKHLLKELTISDIMVALIHQETTPDRTQELKQYLYKTIRQIEQPDREAEQLIILPEFAEKEMTEEQLFLYHLEKNNWSGDQYLNYESLLDSVDRRRKSIIDSSANIFEKSETIMAELIDKLGESYAFVHQNHKPLHALSKHLQHEYLSINRKIVKIRNMEKALDVMRLWNKSNISKILTIKVENILQYSNIAELFQNFNQITQFLKGNQQQLLSYANLISLISQRQKSIVYKIYDNIVASIIEYTNESQYGVKFNQYQYILENNLILPEYVGKIQRECVLKEEKLFGVLERNIHDIYFRILLQKGMGFNIEMLNQDNFIDFFLELMEQFSKYFSNWHKVTTYHMHHQTHYNEGFIKYRTLVYKKMLERISQSLKFSSKFTFLGVSKQLELFEKIQDFIECGQQWMGKCVTNLPQILLQKYKSQMETFSKSNNSDLKNTLFQQFSINIVLDESGKEDDKHFKESDRIKTKLRLIDEMQAQVRQFLRLKVDLNKIERLFYQKETLEKKANSVLLLTQQQFSTEINTFYDKLNTKLGCKLFKSIIEYQLREHYLPDNTQLSLIYQHIEFIVVILYKVCIPGNMKREIEKEIFSDFEKEQRMGAVKVAINRNNIQESTFATINELRHIFKERNAFGQLYDFLCSIGSKYEGTSIATYINPNVYFMDYEKYQAQIAQLNQKILTVMNELYIITQYLQHVINLNRFYKSPEEVHQKIIHFKQVIPEIIMVYFTSYFESSAQKYYKYVVPLFLNLKFDIKKLAADTLIPFKQYRIKISEIYRQNNVTKYSQNTCFNQMLFIKQIQYFYKFLIDLFCKIEKISDNGRQILKSQQSQLTRLVGLDKSFNNEDNWLNLLDLFLETSKQRNEKVILQKVEKLFIEFPIQWWKSNIVWVYHDASSKQKKEYIGKLVSAYYNKILSLPKI